MPTIINGTTDAVTFPDSTIQNTSAVVSGKVPFSVLPAGSVLQVVNATTSTETTTATNTFVDTTLTATITPKFATSKILVIVNQNGCLKLTNNTYLYLRLLRGATTISNFERLAGWTNSSAANNIGGCSISYLDSPATTSATTYKTQIASGANSATVLVQTTDGGVSAMSTITLMEIAG
jgi:hypothetical protein